MHHIKDLPKIDHKGGHFGFMCFSFLNMMFSDYRLLLTRRLKRVEIVMTAVMYRLQHHGGRGQRIVIRKPESWIYKARTCSFFSWLDNLMVSTHFLSFSPR